MTYDPGDLTFYMKANWRYRPDDRLASIIKSFQGFFDELIEIDITLSDWILGTVHERPYAAAREDLFDFFEKNVARDDMGDIEPVSGYSIGGRTLDKRQCYWLYSRIGLRYDSLFGNIILLKTNPHYAPANPTIVTYRLMRAVMLAAIDNWAPDFCAAYSSALEFDNDEGRYRKAWISYVPPEFVATVDLVGVPFSERTDNGGLLLSATNETFDAANPAHVAGAQRIAWALGHLDAPTQPSDLG